MLPYLIGVGQYHSCIFYHRTHDDWSACAHLNVQYRLQPGCAMDSASVWLFVFGGRIADTPVYPHEIEKYNVMGNTWAIISTAILQEPRNSPACILFSTYDNQIYCAGGYNGTYLPTIDIFDPLTFWPMSAFYGRRGGFVESTTLSTI